jgi:hypothetical protein
MISKSILRESSLSGSDIKIRCAVRDEKKDGKPNSKTSNPQNFIEVFFIH